jgi:hypothetical protein
MSAPVQRTHRRPDPKGGPRGRAARPAETGLTLIELVMALGISLFIVGTLALSLMAFVGNDTHNRSRLDSAAGLEVLVTYLQRDFSSAALATPAPSPSICSNMQNALTLTWRQWSASSASPVPTPSTTYYAAYAVSPEPVSGRPTTYAVSRFLCTATAINSSPVPQSSLLLAQGLTSSTSFSVIATPSPSPTPCPSGSPLVVAVTTFSSDAPSLTSQIDGCVGGRGQQ